MSTTEKPKPKFQRAFAMSVAEEICGWLRPAVTRQIVAGSIRRGKAMVSDIEILYVAKTELRKTDFFNPTEADLAEEMIFRLLTEKVIARRPSKTGVFSWGAKNKLAVHLASGIPVDFFATTAEAWANYLVCRTGPAASNVRIAAAAKAKGWQWNPYGAGFSRDGQTEAMGSEEEVFKFVGLKYLPPEDRF